LTASEAQSGDAQSDGAKDFRPGSANAVGKTGLTRGAHASAVDREKAPRTEGMNQRRKRTSAITPTARVGKAAWAGLWALAYGRREASGNRLGQRPSGLQVRPGRKRRKEIFELKIGFLNLPRLWKFA
jgi:hypothetical protein